jgi:hypothetical protein
MSLLRDYKLAFVLGVLALTTSETSYAYQFQAGVLAYKQARYEEAEGLWLQVTSGPDFANAAFNLAILYENGHGKYRADGVDLKWYRIAAKSGSMPAQFNLGGLYYSGTRVARDIDQAIYWWAQAGNQGHSEAQHNLGVLLADGKNLPQDLDKARDWLQLAAAQRYQPAIDLLKTIDIAIEKNRPNKQAALEDNWQRDHEYWLFQQDPEDYSLELMRSTSQREVIEFIESMGLQEIAKVYQTGWHMVVLAGVFNTHNDAKNAITNLTEELQTQNPKPRKLAYVQRELREN